MTEKQLDRAILLIDKSVERLVNHCNEHEDDNYAHDALQIIASFTTTMASRFARYERERDGTKAIRSVGCKP